MKSEKSKTDLCHFFVLKPELNLCNAHSIMSYAGWWLANSYCPKIPDMIRPTNSNSKIIHCAVLPIECCFMCRKLPFCFVAAC